MNQKHWDNFYKKFDELEPSSFAKSLKFENKIIIDLGCGNGRDSYYFGKTNLVIGIDSAVKNKDTENIRFFKTDINEFIKWGYQADVVYCRFLFHSIDEETEDAILKYARDNKCEIAIETRVKGDRPVLFTDHKRREIDSDILLKKVSDLGFACNIQGGYGLAVYKNEDPLVLRIVGK